jgi:pSer/pThr/pTyr-binding forkhead associated (FHA) protein
MIHLTMTIDGAAPKEYILDKDVVTIGRAPENDIHIENIGISAHHAKITAANQQIEDLDSSNHTFVNGREIKTRQLENGDVIKIGRYEIHFINKSGWVIKTPVITGRYNRFVDIKKAHCPKCGHIRREYDPITACQACGVVYINHSNPPIEESILTASMLKTYRSLVFEKHIKPRRDFLTGFTIKKAIGIVASAMLVVVCIDYSYFV